MTFTASESETDENWEDVSTDSSHAETIPSKDANVKTNRPAALKPWSDKEILIDSNKKVSKIKVAGGNVCPFEKDKEAVIFLEKLYNSKNFDINNSEITKRIFDLVSQNYCQIAHDTNKPIIVEFDSLFLTIFTSPIAEGFFKGFPQTLPIVFGAEKYLKTLSSGNRKIEIHAFDTFATFWPCPIQRLIREALLLHLENSLNSLPNFVVRRFTNILDGKWTAIKQLISPSCVLISGGAREDERIGSPLIWHSIRKLAIYLLSTGFCCARIDEIFYVSNAVYGFVFDPPIGMAHKIKQWPELKEETETKEEKIEIKVPIEKIKENFPRKMVPLVFAVSNVLSEEVETTETKIFPILQVARTLLMAELLKDNLSIEDRIDFKDLPKINQNELCFYGKTCEWMFRAVRTDQVKELDTFDIVDLRVYSASKKLLAKSDESEDITGEDIVQINEIWNKMAEFESLKFIANEKGFYSENGQETTEQLKVKTFALHKMAGKTASSLDQVGPLLSEHNLIYDDPEFSAQNDKSDLETNLFICEQIERAMEEMNVRHMNKEEEKQSMFGKSKFYAFMKKYSESLAAPKIVLRDVVVENMPEKDGKEKTKKGKKGKPVKGNKKGKNTRKEEIIEMNRIRKKQKQRENLLIFIKQALKHLSLEEKIGKLDSKLLPLKDPIIALPGQLQLLEWLKENYQKSNPQTDKSPATLLFRNVFDILRRFHNSLNAAQINKLQTALLMMGFKSESEKMVQNFNKVRGKTLAKPISLTKDIDCEPVGMNSVRFQLEHAGHFMVRSIKSQEDPRVSDFFPDDWQRLFLDAVDRKESALVVTPTSSGKTFISYYTMKNVLEVNKAQERRSDRGMVVFVCPSKALVNQVSADIYARFGEIFGVYTRDYSHSVLECQVLVTVPECFEKILLSPPFEPLVKRIKYVIMDEIHSIGDALGGEIWERIIKLLLCPFVALSATLGRPETFHKWLKSVSAALESAEGPPRPKVNLIEFYERWSDLEKYIYIPTSARYPALTLENMELGDKSESSLVPINPLAVFKFSVCRAENFNLPEIDFTSKDCLHVYDAMQRVTDKLRTDLKAETQKELSRLKPETYFQSPCITKNEVTLYGKELKQLLRNWHSKGAWEVVNGVLEDLSAELSTKIRKMETEDKSEPEAPGKERDLGNLPNVQKKTFDGPYSSDFMCRHLIPLLVQLRNNADLPALVFVNSQYTSDSLALNILTYLEDNEKRVISRTDMKERLRRKKQLVKQAKAWKRERDRIDKRKEEEMLKEGTIPPVDIDDKDELDFRFSFIGPGESADDDDIKYWLVRTLRKNKWTKGHPFLRCIERGIALHHDGMTRPYRTLVEVLFRAKHIKVVLTVGTLALGVNMPCRTTVFAGDSADLTPLKFQQMMGRAGRRGYDNIGKVIFFAIPPQKVSYLMTSSLLTLHGHGSMTMALFLRGMFCIAASDEKEFRLRCFKNLMKDTFGDDFREDGVSPDIKMLYRYSMEFLYQNKLCNRKLVPGGTAGLVTRLYPHEPSNFVFAAMFAGGVFRDICSPLSGNVYLELKDRTSDRLRNEQAVCCRLMEILTHVFLRIPLPAGYCRPPYFNSKLILDPLPPKAQAVLDRFNASSVALFTQFLRLCQLSSAEAETLPLSGKTAGKTGEKSPVKETDKLSAMSRFARLSGADDTFRSGQEMRLSARQFDLSFSRTDSLPVVETKDAMGRDLALNSYALDFFKHGSLQQLIKENNLGELFAWNQLKKWSLALRGMKEGLEHLSERAENADSSLRENAVACMPAFSALSEMFDASFKKIGEIVEYK